MKHQPWSPELIKVCLEKTHVHFLNDSETIANASKDFGALIKGHAAAVVFPRTSADFEALFDFANKNNLTFSKAIVRCL